MKEENTDWKSTVEKLSHLFKEYSAGDVATALFVSSLWLPNNGSTIKHLLWTTILASLKAEDFAKDNGITKYKDFKEFCEKLYAQTPSFPYWKTTSQIFDWGTVKFHHNKVNYKIFYGTEISHIYDFLTAFQLVYVSFDKEYEALSGRSPSLELRQCFSIQNKIIESIDEQPAEDKLVRIPLGHIEIAPKKFWIQATRIFDTLSNSDYNNLSGQDDYVIEPGTIPKESLNFDQFGNKAFEGSLVSGYFISNKGRYLPILPRRYSGILIDKWSNIFSKYGSFIKKGSFDYQKELSFQVANYLQQRFHKGRFYPIVSAIQDDGKPHELTFSGYILSEDKLVLFYTVNPFNTEVGIEKELKELTPKLKEALRLISKEPVTLGLHIERKNVVYEPTVPDRKLKIDLFVILPQATNKMIKIAGPKELPGDIAFIDQFLGVMDEIDEHDELSQFIDYLRNVENRISAPITTLLDKYGSFKDSSGVLIPGANEPNMIMIDLQWGTDFRYKSLKEFWSIYPEIDFMDHPRSWRVKQETPSRVRLSAKSYLGCAIHLKILDTHIFLTSPLDKQEYIQGSISNLLMECLEDYMSRFQSILQKHSFFQTYTELEVIIFPSTFLKEDEFKHILHLDPKDKYWKSDTGYPKPSCPGIRLVFNHEKLLEVFKDSTKNDIEVELLIEVITQLNKFSPDPNLAKYISEIEKIKGGRPRFKTIHMSKGVAFPEFIKAEIPTLHDHKLSRKTEAEIALSHGIKPGKYKLDKAKKIMNDLRKEMVREIDREVALYSYDENIKYLITRIDALINDFVVEKLRLEESLKHEVDFVREEQYSEAHEKFTPQHKDYRYLIEKFVQITPKGTKRLDDRSFRYLVALVDKISEIYSASDNLNYEIYSVGLTIDRDFLFQVKYKDDLDSMQKKYGLGQARIELGSDGNQSDRVDSSIPIEDHLTQLDEAFKKDFGFGVRNLVNVLQVLSMWPGYMKGVKEAAYYSATKEEIGKAAKTSIKGYDLLETDKILDFLTLKQEGMLTVLGSPKAADDLPVWEHRNRPYRYTIKPLFNMGGKYYWGPHSAERSARVWVNITTNGTLPANLTAPNVNKVLHENQVTLEKDLEVKALEISKRHTIYAERVNYGRRTHDQSLGEYDVLAYLPQKNILLNIECKDIIGAFCLKDAKRIRDRIFRLEQEKGRKVKNPGNLLKVEKREVWLGKNIPTFVKVLKWPIKNNPKIISVYITRTDYWWTKFPPRPTTVKFMRIDFLEKFIKDQIS